MQKILFAGLLVPLSACGGFVENENMVNQMAASKNSTAENTTTSLQDNVVDSANTTDNIIDNATSNAVTPAGVRSTYTEITDKSCKTIETTEEGGGGVDRCPGYGGVPLFVKEGDLRISIDAGVESDDFATMGQFNTIGGPVEWRIGSDGRPYAIIYRLRADDPEHDKTSTTIFVKSVGREGKPGCTVAEIRGNAANANEQARAKADAVPGGVVCLKD